MKLLTAVCPTNGRGDWIAPDLAEEQTLENLAAFGRRLDAAYSEMKGAAA